MPTDFKPTHTYGGLYCSVANEAKPGWYVITYSDGNVGYAHGSQLVPIQNPESPNRNYKPDHYHSGGIDPWQFIEANMNPQQAIGFHLGNVLKYVARHEKKNGLEDLKKALDSLREGIRLYEKHYPETDS